MLFRLTSSDFLNDVVSLGDDMLFTVTTTEQECVS